MKFDQSTFSTWWYKWMNVDFHLKQKHGFDENKTKDNASWYYKLTFLYVYFIALWDTMTFIAFCRKPTILDVINSGTNFNLKGRNWVLEGKIIYKLVHEWSTNTLQNHDDKQVVKEIQSYYGFHYVPLLTLCFVLYWVFVQFFYVAASKYFENIFTFENLCI